MMWLPPSVEAQLVEERRAHDALAGRFIVQTAKRFTRELKRIDPYLELVYISRPRDWPDDQGAPAGIVFDRWHVMRHNPDAPDSFLPHTTPDGGYREPDSGVFEMVRRSDMWNGEAFQRATKRRARAAEERERERRDLKDEAREEVRIRLKALESPSVWLGARTARATGRGG